MSVGVSRQAINLLQNISQSFFCVLCAIDDLISQIETKS